MITNRLAVNRALPQARAGRVPRPHGEPGPLAIRRRIAHAAVRALDVVVALALLGLLALPMLVIAVLVRRDSPGPALYRQRRVGLRGKTFIIYKFRTMHIGAEAETGPIWAKRGDPRCTPLGRRLRRFGLDELPQLFNVLAGDMSLVGPRPERPYFVRKFAQVIPDYHQRHEVRPGITGWAQINGWRGDSSLARRVECDLFYVRNWSPAFYLRILLVTPLRILVDRNGS
jgi:lipopolysaccharide/colanic/teichoic acid biosynthesis glycosyltransferase